jgi:GT2 family glycosyltransferase
MLLFMSAHLKADCELMELDVIVLNWNAAPDTIRCVRSIETWESLHPTIWVVDNGSTPDSVQAVIRECPRVHLIRNQHNLGFAGGNNKAIAKALSISNRPILLLNNDTHVEQGDVVQLLTTLQADGEIGLVGPLLFDAARPDRLISAGGKDIAWHVNSHVLQIPVDVPHYIVDYVPGTVVAIRPDVFRVVGLLDEDYFFGGEVADLCKRARQRGYTSVVDTRARATHSVDRSSDIREKLHIYYVFRNRFLFIHKFYRVGKPALYGFWIVYGLGMSLKADLTGKHAKARAIRTGILDGLTGRFGGQNERVRWQGQAGRA